MLAIWCSGRVVICCLVLCILVCREGRGRGDPSDQRHSCQTCWRCLRLGRDNFYEGYFSSEGTWPRSGSREHHINSCSVKRVLWYVREGLGPSPSQRPLIGTGLGCARFKGLPEYVEWVSRFHGSAITGRRTAESETASANTCGGNCKENGHHLGAKKLNDGHARQPHFGQHIYTE